MEFDQFQIGVLANKTKLLYAWKSCLHNKFYSGLAVKYVMNYFSHNSNSLQAVPSGNVLYGYFVPIGFEWFPFKRLRGTSLIAEMNIGYDPAFVNAADWGTYIGLCCYF